MACFADCTSLFAAYNLLLVTHRKATPRPEEATDKTNLMDVIAHQDLGVGYKKQSYGEIYKYLARHGLTTYSLRRHFMNMVEEKVPPSEHERYTLHLDTRAAFYKSMKGSRDVNQVSNSGIGAWRGGGTICQVTVSPIYQARIPRIFSISRLSAQKCGGLCVT